MKSGSRIAVSSRRRAEYDGEFPLTRRSGFSQAEITRAVRGAIAAGIPVAAVTIEDGKIIVLTAPPPARDSSGAKDAADVVAARLSQESGGDGRR